MKIAFVLPHGWRFSGWSLHDVMTRYHFSKHLAAAISERGHRVTLFLVHEELARPRIVQTDPFRVEALPVTSRVPFLKFGGELSIPLLRRLREAEAQVVHIHGCFDEVLPLLLLAARSPTVLHWHGGRLMPFHRTVFRRACRRARRVIVPFPGAREGLRGVIPEDDKFETIPLPMRPEAAAARPRNRYGMSRRLLYVGRIPTPRRNIWERRPDLLVRMLGQPPLTDVVLDVVGDGPGRSICEKVASEAHVADRVRFHGFLGLRDAMTFYQEADLTVVPCALMDLTGTWGGQVQESLAVGTPVVAFHPDGGFTDHACGWRISADPSEGASRLSDILSQPALIEAKGRQAVGVVRTACDEREVARRLEALYEGLAAA